MTKLSRLAIAATALLVLSACGGSDAADEQAKVDNVEMPAEEAVNDLDAVATPVPDAAATTGADAATSDAAAQPATSEAARQ